MGAILYYYLKDKNIKFPSPDVDCNRLAAIIFAVILLVAWLGTR